LKHSIILIINSWDLQRGTMLRFEVNKLFFRKKIYKIQAMKKNH
jgi:hypothetical protein